MQSMKGATVLLGSMNRQMNLPALQRIVMEFERENEIMDERQEMMDDAIDEATGLEDEEESEDIVKEVLDEIGVDLGQAVRLLILSLLIPPHTHTRSHTVQLIPSVVWRNPGGYRQRRSWRDSRGSGDRRWSGRRR